MNTKRCPSCRRELPFNCFTKSSNRKDGLYWQCKDCHSEKRKVVRNSPEGREKSAAYARKWRKENPEKHAAINRNWDRRHPEKKAAIAKRERTKNATRYRLAGRVTMALRRALGRFTRNDVTDMLKHQKGRCYYCGEKLGDEYHIDHVVPVSRGGRGDPSNLVAACPACNHKKGAKLPHEWAEGGRLL